jgi:hypothetical protein
MLREEHRYRVSEKKMLMGVSGPGADVTTGGGRNCMLMGFMTVLLAKYI